MALLMISRTLLVLDATGAVVLLVVGALSVGWMKFQFLITALANTLCCCSFVEGGTAELVVYGCG